MAGVTLHIHDFDRPRIECANDEPTIWVRTRDGHTVSLALDRERRSAMRAALAKADELDPCPGCKETLDGQTVCCQEGVQ